MKKLLAVIFIAILILPGCQPSKKKTITIKGSDTMVNLTQKWAEVYMNKNPDVSVQVTGGGSGTGIAALFNGTANIANISRELTESELLKFPDYKIKPIQFKVALDGIAIIVNSENPVDTLTLDQLKEIFSGKIKNWRELNGFDREIVLYGRENSSGTYEYFKNGILGRDQFGREIDFSQSMQVLQGTAQLGEAISKDLKGIGFGGVGYFAQRKDVKCIFIKSANESKAISAVENGKVNYESIRNGLYPLARYLFCCTNGEPKNEVKSFIDFIRSEEGQKIVQQMEYIPLSD